jgi:hypothetical protein
VRCSMLEIHRWESSAESLLGHSKAAGS